MQNSHTQIRPKPQPRKRALTAAAFLLLCLPLQSCFTTGLWASDIGGREKAYLTPLSLTLDAVTFPVQVALLKGGHHHHHRRCR